jgi:hypothetical protein
VEHSPGAFIQHVGINALGFQQRNPMLPLGALGLELGQLSAEFGILLIEFLLGEQPVISGVGVGAEIADQPRAREAAVNRVNEALPGALLCPPCATCETPSE